MPPVSSSRNSDAAPRRRLLDHIARRARRPAVTIARRVAVIRLNSVDLPTLGRPTSTTSGAREPRRTIVTRGLDRARRPDQMAPDPAQVVGNRAAA